LRDVYANVRLAHAQVVLNSNGTPTIVYELKNFSNRRLVLPQTRIGDTLAFWAGDRQHWIGRVGGGPIPPLAGSATRGDLYAYGGSAIPTSGVLEAGEVLRFSQPVNTAGFPPGRYNFVIEYRTLDRVVIHAHVVTFTVS
jgi:hypothetical protein